MNILSKIYLKTETLYFLFAPEVVASRICCKGSIAGYQGNAHLILTYKIQDKKGRSLCPALIEEIVNNEIDVFFALSKVMCDRTCLN